MFGTHKIRQSPWLTALFSILLLLGLQGGTSHLAFAQSAAGPAAASVPAQTASALLFVDSTTIIGQLRDGTLYTGPEQVAFNLMGNTLFEGNSTARDAMVYLIGILDPFGKKDQYVYFSDGEEIAFTMASGVLYFGELSDPDLERLLRVVPLEEGFWEIRSGIDDLSLGVLAVEGELRPAEWFTCLHQYVLHYDLDRRVNQRIAALYLGAGGGIDGGPGAGGASDLPAGGRMRLYLDGNPYYEWEFDGNILKPVWGIRSDDEWSYDGQYIRPVFGMVSRQEWIWDGRMLKPYWSPEPANQWIWDNGILRRFWSGNPDEEWRLADGLVGPHWSQDPTRTWVVEGNFPLPLIAMVVLGIADR